jgi:Na+/proline symporter
MAVMLSEAIQTVILVVGATVITFYAWTAMGGWGPMMEVLHAQGEIPASRCCVPTAIPRVCPGI